MLISNTLKKGGLIESVPVDKFTDEIRKKALEKIQYFRVRRLISSEFSDAKWYLTDQQRNYTVDFSWQEQKIREACNQTGRDYDSLISDLKVFFLYLYGSCNIELLQEIVGYSLTELSRSRAFTQNISPSMTGAAVSLRYYIEFAHISHAPACYLSVCRKTLSEINAKIALTSGKKYGDHQASLNEFQSYFKFDDVIRTFWSENKDKEEKMFYFPLYLFWTVTTILPQRVTEFCLTPYDCIRKDLESGQYYLTIRRSILKGSNMNMPKIHNYEIDKDYQKSEYEIPKWLFQEFYEYKQITKQYSHPYGLLFSVDYILLKFPDRLRTKQHEKVFTATNLSEILTDFYKNVVVKQYGYKIVPESVLMERYASCEDGSYELGKDEIMRILLKHTRHLAMINLILRGANPVIIKEFAGHVDAATSAHYYSNISNTVRCAAKYYYEKAHAKDKRIGKRDYIGTESSGNPLSLLINREDRHVEVDHGWCYSGNFLNGDITDCRFVDGACENCRYFVRNPSAPDDTDNLEMKVDNEIQFLITLLQKQDITAAISESQAQIQQLESDVYNLATRIWRQEKEKQEADHGKT